MLTVGLTAGRVWDSPDVMHALFVPALTALGLEGRTSACTNFLVKPLDFVAENDCLHLVDGQVEIAMFNHSFGK